MELQPLTENLIPQMAALEALCFSLPWTEEMIANELKKTNCIYLAALDNDKLIGYIGMQSVLDEGYINNVAVHPDYRRQGVASALLSNLIELARQSQLAFLTLEVRKSNSSAIALYTGFGFTPVGIRKNYYVKPREDAILMTIFFTKE